MSEQQQSRVQRRATDEDEIATLPQGLVDHEGFDALLDEIDEVLETNAEEFVRSFVQKGGQ